MQSKDTYSLKIEVYFLGAFPKLQKAVISLVMPVCPFVRWNNPASNGKIY